MGGEEVVASPEAPTTQAARLAPQDTLSLESHPLVEARRHRVGLGTNYGGELGRRDTQPSVDAAQVPNLTGVTAV